MRAIERLRARRFLLPVLAGLAIGTVAGLLWPAPPSARQDAPDASQRASTSGIVVR